MNGMTPDQKTALETFQDHVRQAPDDPQLTYFDTTLSVRQVDELSDAMARALESFGIAPGARIALFMQNMPHFAITLLAAWKLGAIPVPLNPMLRTTELKHHLDDSGAELLVALDNLWEGVARDVVGSTGVGTVIIASPRSLQHRDDNRLQLEEDVSVTGDVVRFEDLLVRFEGKAPQPRGASLDDVAFLCYTSGTTGPSKGSVSTHRNVVEIARTICEVADLDSDSRVLGLAPLFHITGIMVQLVPALLARSVLILSYRYHPGVMLDSIKEHLPTFSVGPITAYIGLLQHPEFSKEYFRSFDRVYSGGAPISPSTARTFEERTGQQLLGAYGMTEATAATHLTPKGERSPVDPMTGALSVGKAIPGVSVRIIDDAGSDVPNGTPGEVLLSSGGVIAGYWHRPEDTAATIRDGWLHSGDIGVVDDDGWLYLVDRKKDLINCSGFKVWPREVEDALYEHPAVLEAAVIGVPDPYRGETVKAYVSLKEPESVSSDALQDFVRTRLAAYKRPEVIEILDDLPKTSSGKILRRALREEPSNGLSAASLDQK